MLKLHHAPNSRAGRIVWLFEELGLEYEINKMDFDPAALKSPEHRARHPLGRVPVLEDDDVMLYESGAIVEYIITRHSDGQLKPEVNSALYPEYLQWFHYCEGMIMPPVNTIVVQTILLPPDRQNKVALGQAERLLKKAVVPINGVLKDRQYLIGDFSGADIMLGHACYMSKRLGCVDNDMANLLAYIKRLEQRPGFQTGINA